MNKKPNTAEEKKYFQIGFERLAPEYSTYNDLYWGMVADANKHFELNTKKNPSKGWEKLAKPFLSEEIALFRRDALMHHTLGGLSVFVCWLYDNYDKEGNKLEQ